MFQYLVKYSTKSFKINVITTDTSKNTFKTLDFLLNVIEMIFKSKKLPENRQSPEAIQVQSDMSHMRRLALFCRAFSLLPLPGCAGRWLITCEWQRSGGWCITGDW